jgi:hypothetical protein
MSDGERVSGIRCRGLETAELEKVERLTPIIVRRLAAGGGSVCTCNAVGSDGGRMLYFLDQGGRFVGSVKATDFLEADDDLAAGVITAWRD